MFKHLLKLIWNKKKQNFLLISEILFSFMVIFAVFTFGIYCWDNYKQPMGMEYENVLAVNFTNPVKTTNADSLRLFYETVKRNLKSLPEVDEVSYASVNIPFSESTINNSMDINGKNIRQINEFSGEDSYPGVVNLKMAEGRWYNKQDGLPGTRNMVINRALKEKAFGDVPVVGKFLGDPAKPSERFKIIGVIENIKFNGDYQSPALAIYKRMDTAGYKWVSNMLIKVRPSADAAFESRLYKTLANSLNNANVEIEHLANKRISINKMTLVPMIILSIVAGFLIINVALGLFGVLWYNINKRRGEIGLRRALGATGNGVSSQIVWEAMILATFSMIIGSFFAVQFPLLNVFDLPAMVYIIALLASVLFIYALVLVCSLYPGRQAAAIYPAVALHEE
ncbi:FtsX-like permease family protein [Flavihumibacter sp. R14]|nr:FtsX-like permease family protein [Flavihumibacter soli]